MLKNLDRLMRLKISWKELTEKPISMEIKARRLNSLQSTSLSVGVNNKTHIQIFHL